MRRVVRILSLLCNQRGIELIRTPNVSRVNVRTRLAVGLLHTSALNKSAVLLESFYTIEGTAAGLYVQVTAPE